MKRVLITGGAGFIGSALAQRLAGTGQYEVTVLDNLSPQIHGESASFAPDLEACSRCIRGDVTSPDDCDVALEGQDFVVHLAAETGTGQSMYEIRRYCDVNVIGTAVLLEACKERKDDLKKVVIASSRAVYGEGKYQCQRCGPVFPGPRNSDRMATGDFEVHCPICDAEVHTVPTNEDSPTTPLSIYGATKLTQEHLLRVFAASFDISAVAFRFQNVYGPGQSLHNPYTGILSIFSTRILNENPIEIYEDGQESRDFVFIEDVVNAVRQSLERETGPYNCYNVGTGVYTSVEALTEALMVELDSRVPLLREGKFRLGDIRHNSADLSRVGGDLGFVPGWTLDDGLRQFVDWVREFGPIEDRYEASLEKMKGDNLLRKIGS
jgi:dTDP-L-rhamnose 4-epimerase